MKAKLIALLVVLVSSLTWTGCVSYPDSAAMTPNSVEIKNRSSQAVMIRVEGEPKVEKIIQISNSAFTEALRTAIRNSRLFARVGSNISEGYHLEVRIMGYNPPRPGANMTATMTTHWKLTRLTNQEAVFEDFIKKDHTCTVGDAFVGATRWRMTHEGVARDTIAEGMHRLSQTSW